TRASRVQGRDLGKGGRVPPAGRDSRGGTLGPPRSGGVVRTGAVSSAKDAGDAGDAGTIGRSAPRASTLALVGRRTWEALLISPRSGAPGADARGSAPPGEGLGLDRPVPLGDRRLESSSRVRSERREYRRLPRRCLAHGGRTLHPRLGLPHCRRLSESRIFPEKGGARRPRAGRQPAARQRAGRGPPAHGSSLRGVALVVGCPSWRARSLR